MRSCFTRLSYSIIDPFHKRKSLRLASTVGLILAFALLAACGGGSSDSQCNPAIEQCGSNGGGDNGGGDNGGGEDPGDHDDGSGDDDSGGGDIIDISLTELREHIHSLPESKRPPKFEKWEDHMIEYGHNVGQFIQSNADRDLRLEAVYYDGQRVFLQISQYLGRHDPWVGYSETASDLYRHYIDENDGQLAGYWRFPHGSLMDYLLHDDETAYKYVIELRDKPTFSDPTRDIADKWFQVVRCREVAYSLQGHIVAAKAGAGIDHEKVDRLVNMALGHIDIWTSGDYITNDEDWKRIKPFMAGLTASSLIEYYQYTVEHGEPDDRVLPAVRKLADWLWEDSGMWISNVNGSGYGAFDYVQYADGRDGDNPSGDLNLLVAPMYGWLYNETGEHRFLVRGDKIFAGAIELAWLGNGKQFNQSYRDSFKFLRWRQEGIAHWGM